MLRDEPMNSTVFRILFDINPLLRRANFFKTKLCPSLQFYLIRICNFSMNCQYSSEASQPEPEESNVTRMRTGSPWPGPRMRSFDTHN